MSYFGSSGPVNLRPVRTETVSRVISVGNAIDWAKAEASLALQGPVSSEVFEFRKSKCIGCEELATNTEPQDNIGFCKACGCGTSARAALSVKLTMPEAKCPKQRW